MPGYSVFRRSERSKLEERRMGSGTGGGTAMIDRFGADMSMGMLPPVMISLSFKILIFVLVDGWVPAGNLVESFK